MSPFRVGPDGAYRNRGSAEGSDVGDGVRAAPEHVFLPGVPEDENRRLARDPLREPEHEPVENEVARDRDPSPREAVHELVEPGSDGGDSRPDLIVTEIERRSC